MLRQWIIPVLLLSLAACGRPDFGSTNAGGGVVDVDVEREPANDDEASANNGVGAGAGGMNNGSANNADGVPPDRVDGGYSGVSGDFAFNVYGSAAMHGRNALVAPHGLARSLVVAYAAADDATAQIAAEALQPYLNGSTFESFNSADLNLSASEDNTFEMLASVWLDESVAVEASFAEDLARYLGLELRLVDMAASPEDARNQINNWYGDQTGGRISEVVGARTLDASTRFIVTDATWLSTSWAFGGFDPGRTSYETFEGTESNVQLPMMHADITARHFGDETLQTVVLPLSNGFSLIAVLPADLDAFEASLDDSFLRRLLDEAAPSDIALSMPRIELSDRVMLSDVAEAVGGSALFGTEAAYDAFADGTTLDDAFQRTRVAFTESGIEVAGDADGDPNEDMAPAPPTSVSVTFDKPFFFAIYAPATDQFVTLGRLTQP